MIFDLNGKNKAPPFGLRILICILSLFFVCSNLIAQENEEKTVITILNALKSSNVKGKDGQDDQILFEGNVQISVVKGVSKTIISADEITYSRKHEMLYAAGNVELEQTDKSGSVSNISAATVLFNTSTLEGIFDDGRIVQADTNTLNMPTGSTLVVASDVFARNHSGTVAFKKGELTFCDDINPHWKIRASRIWLLPGNEFAFLNAVLFLDNIPVFYLPAFYYPKDELVFNPVFGYRNRAGFFVQTTTYLYGRKPLEPTNNSLSSSSDSDDVAKYFNFIKPTKLMDQKLEGIVLHNLDTVYTGDTSNYLKLMADWYSNLGFGVGLDGVFKPNKFFSVLEGNLFLGFGNTIYTTSYPNVYLPFNANGQRDYETSDFMGAKLPFRYKAGFKIGINEPFSLTLNMPIYSDPYFNYDFGDRSETMDWFSYLLNNPVAENTTTTETQKRDASEITSFTWDLSGNYTIKLPDSIKPYIDSATISSFNSSIAFAAKTYKDNTPYAGTDKPDRKFFYPSQITPIKLNASISGTIFSTDIEKKTKAKSNIEFPVSLIAPEEIAIPVKNTSTETSEKNVSSDSGFDFERDGLGNIEFLKPSVSQSSQKDFSFNLKYSIQPDFGTQLTYSPTGLDTGADFKWDRVQSSYLYLKVPVNFTDSLSWKNNFLSMNNSVAFRPSYQVHPYLLEDQTFGGYDAANIKSIKQSDYTASSFEIVNSNTVSIKPFIYNPVLKNTGLSYNTSIKFFRTKFIGDADNTEWERLTVDFSDPDSITTHSLDLTLSAVELDGDFSQSLILSSTLPPQLAKYYGTLKLGFPYVTLTGEAGIRQKSITDKSWVKDQIREGLTVSLFNNKVNLSQSFNYDTEENRPDALKLSLSYSGLQLAYTMKHSATYDFRTDEGWVSTNQEAFVPYSASLAYTLPSTTAFKFASDKVTIAPTLSTSLVIDFIRPTNSYFIFSPGLKFKINNFLDFSFSATSRNDVLYRYVQSGLGNPGRIPGEENMFVDLFNSFRFDDESLRKSSGFKLKSLNFTLSHDLHDWDFRADFKIEPRLVTQNDGSKYYDFSPYFSISVVWRPMESIKAEVLDEYGKWQLK